MKWNILTLFYRNLLLVLSQDLKFLRNNWRHYIFSPLRNCQVVAIHSPLEIFVMLVTDFMNTLSTFFHKCSLNAPLKVWGNDVSRLSVLGENDDDRGSGSKTLLNLFKRSTWDRNCFYRVSKLIVVQQLSHLEFFDFGRISYKKWTKLTFENTLR